MPKRVTREWLSGVAQGLASGALALSVLSWGGSALPPAAAPTALADEIDCYNDKDLYDLPECVERRANDKKTGNQQNEAQGATGTPTPDAQAGGGSPPSGGGESQQSSGSTPPSGGSQQAGGGSPPPAGGGNQQTGGGSPPPSGGGQQAASSDDEEEAEKPRGPVTDPWQVVLKLEDAGKEATQYISDEGTDKHGKFARTRYERDRSNGASTLGPNVIDSKVWITKDAEAAKALFKEQAAIKNFPERKEGVTGMVEKIKPASYGEEFAYVGGYWQDEKVWQHHRFVIRQGNLVSVVYLFGREDFFLDEKDKGWTGQGDWYTAAVFHRM